MTHIGGELNGVQTGNLAHVSQELLINKQHTLEHMLRINKCMCISHNQFLLVLLFKR